MLQRTTVHHVTQDIGSTMDFVLTLVINTCFTIKPPKHARAAIIQQTEADVKNVMELE
jgi:hypothetical protein